MISLNELLPSQGAWDVMKKQGAELLKSGFIPSSIKSPEQFLAVILKGRELGLPPMYSCAHIVIIQGKPTMSAEVMLAMIFKNCPGTKIQYLEVTNEKCTIKASRPGGEPSTFSFSMADAKAAGLDTKENWRKYPRAMLRSRCISELARSLFPDSLSGVSYTAEELGATVNEDGEVVETKLDSNKTIQVVAAEPTVPKVAVGFDPTVAAQKEWFWKQVNEYIVPKESVIIDEFIGMSSAEIITYFATLYRREKQ